MFKPEEWGNGIDRRIADGSAQRVSVTGSRFPSVHEAVLFDDEFVTVSELERRLQATRDEMLSAALVHCRGLRKIARSLRPPSTCDLCDQSNPGYKCDVCKKIVCSVCFPMAFQQRVIQHQADSSIEYTCPFCIQSFANFPELSLEERDGQS